MACIRLIDDRIGPQVPANSIEQLATFTDPKWVTGIRVLALACMTYLPSTPRSYPGYGAIGAQRSALDKDQGNYVITHDQQGIILGPTGHLASDHIQIITTAISQIKNEPDCQSQILRILGNTLTLRQAHEVFAALLGTTIDRIDNSNSKKTRSHLFKEVGAATLNHSGWPPELYQLN